MFPKVHPVCVRVCVCPSAFCLLTVHAGLSLEPPLVPGWCVLLGQVLVGSLGAAGGSGCSCWRCGLEVFLQHLLSQMRVDAEVLLDGGQGLHFQGPCAGRGRAAAGAWDRGTAAGLRKGPTQGLLMQQGGGRDPGGGGEGGRLKWLDDAHGRRLWVVPELGILMVGGEEEGNRRERGVSEEWVNCFTI